ncbi:MAG TPA: hypothetical protein VGL18_02415 [Actinomycetota bacterium]|jgi:hypothetical protein
MDEQRYRELIHKRDTSGLTAREADELGKMLAERDGRPYSGASGRDHPEAQTEEPYSEAEVKELKQHPDVREAPEESEQAS